MEENKKYCKHCGEIIDKDCVICPKCGKQVENIIGNNQPQIQKPTNGLGTAGMIIGIISLVTSCCGLGGFIGIIGLILSVVAVCAKNKPKGNAVAGIVLNVIAVFIMIILFAAAGISDSESDDKVVNNVTNTTTPEENLSDNTNEEITPEPEEEIIMESKEDFINSCQEYSYKDLARNPDDYIGSRIVLEVKIEQVVQGGFLDNNEYYRVYTNDEYDFWLGDEYFMNDMRVDDDTRLLEDDIIRIYGEYAGTQEVKRAISGAKEYVPSINAYYIDLIAE